jgi:hypothetical protein
MSKKTDTSPTPDIVLEKGVEREEAVRKLAYELWQKRGSPPDSPDEDWLEADRLTVL